MGKVTFLTFVSFGLVVFLGTSYYYRTEYIPKRAVIIVPGDKSEMLDDAFVDQTIILNDPTIAKKFVENTHESDMQSGINEVGYTNHGINFVPVESERSGLSNGDKWPRAGEPYIVPQMTENERNLKVKRFQKPKSGVNHGH